MNLDEIDYGAVLALPMERNDAGATTVRAYLAALLSRVWKEDEGFSGKRPFGNSGWSRELYAPLVVAGLVEGYEEEGFHHIKYEGGNEKLAHEIIARAIDALTSAP